MRALGWALADISSVIGNALGKPSSSVRFFLNNLFWFRMALVTGKLQRRWKSFEYILSGFLSLNTSIKRKNFELILLIKNSFHWHFVSLSTCVFVQFRIQPMPHCLWSSDLLRSLSAVSGSGIHLFFRVLTFLEECWLAILQNSPQFDLPNDCS